MVVGDVTERPRVRCAESALRPRGNLSLAGDASDAARLRGRALHIHAVTRNKRSI